MVQLVQLTSNEHDPHVRQLFTEYLQWFHQKFQQQYGFTFEIDPVVSTWMMELNVFYPPKGRIYLARYEDRFVGIGGLKQLVEGIGEIKRMFVQPEYQGRGFGKEILDQLIADARAMGQSKICLDSPKLSTVAHALYLSRGFQFTRPYPGSEGAAIDPGLWVYMELVL